MAQKICANCGYEGLGTRKARGSGQAFRVLGMLLLLPVHTLWKAFTGGRSKNCPHCGLPMMVKKNSDAGRLARQRIDIELGILKPRTVAQDNRERFGAQQPAARIEKTVDPDQW